MLSWSRTVIETLICYYEHTNCFDNELPTYLRVQATIESAPAVNITAQIGASAIKYSVLLIECDWPTQYVFSAFDDAAFITFST